MRIISKFHDYYDGVMSYGFDDSLIYKRKTETGLPDISSNLTKIHKSMPRLRRGQLGLFARPYIIGFCGRLYPMYRIEPDSYQIENRDECVYDIEAMNTYLRKLRGDQAVEDFKKSTGDNLFYKVLIVVLL